MIRLCIVTPFQHGGGAEYQIRMLIRELSRTGRFDIHLLVHHVSAEDEPCQHSVWQIGHGDRPPRLGYLMDFKPLYATLQRIRPDIIYQRVAGGYTGICGLYARRHRVPMIWHVSNDADISRQSLDAGRNFIRRCMERASARYGLSCASHIVVQTTAQAELLRRHHKRLADEIIPNLGEEATEQLDKSGPPTVLWIANLKPVKRPELFLNLAERMHDLETARFLMIGAAPAADSREPWWQHLRERIASMPKIEYLGQLAPAAVNALLARAHVLVNTSLYEGFPNTFIQAWMRRVAVVSLSVDPDALLERAGMGILGGSEPQLAEAVRRLLIDTDARTALIERALQYARARHSLRNAQQLIELIEGSLMARTGLTAGLE